MIVGAILRNLSSQSSDTDGQAEYNAEKRHLIGILINPLIILNIFYEGQLYLKKVQFR